MEVTRSCIEEQRWQPWLRSRKVHSPGADTSPAEVVPTRDGRTFSSIDPLGGREWAGWGDAGVNPTVGAARKAFDTTSTPGAGGGILLVGGGPRPAVRPSRSHALMLTVAVAFGRAQQPFGDLTVPPTGSTVSP
jgi:hypothetical protein